MEARLLPRLRRNRTSIDIIADVLSAALHGEKKTRIVHKANLSCRLAKDVLAYLLWAHLIEADRRGRGTTYRTTRRGKRFLFHYAVMKSLLDESRKALDADDRDAPRPPTL